MKNCKKKIRGVTRGSLWNDNEFDDRMRKLTSRAGGKSLKYSGISGGDEPFSPMITNEDMDHAFKVLSDFIAMEPEWVSYVNDEKNWEHFGELGSDSGVMHSRVSAPGCTCGMC
jgi:hypothetical protein